MRQPKVCLAATTLATVILSFPIAGTAAQRQQSVGIKDGECEVVSVGNYYCMVNGKCYYCTDSQGKSCYQETKCDSAVSRPGTKGGIVRPPTGMNAPIMRRGVDGESTPSGTESTTPQPESK